MIFFFNSIFLAASHAMSSSCNPGNNQSNYPNPVNNISSTFKDKSHINLLHIYIHIYTCTNIFICYVAVYI